MNDFKNRIDAYKDRMIEFACKLIRTPSESGNEKAVADLLIREMESLGYDRVFRDDFGNVIGLVDGSQDGPSLLFNSHMDQVSPGNRADWGDYDPFGGLVDRCEVDNLERTATEPAECIHGRGAADVKGGMAVQVFAGGVLADMKKEGIIFPGRFIFSGVVLEEPAEMAGMLRLINETFPKEGLDYHAMISSEATALKLYCGHRGRVELLVTVFGRTAHGSAPWLGINAIYKALPLLEKLKNELDPSLAADPELGKAAATVTILSCSPGALSIIPDKCFISIDRRLIPGESIDQAVSQIQDILNELAADDPEFKAEVCIKTATEKSYTGAEDTFTKTMAAWKYDTGHPIIQCAAAALRGIGQHAAFGYWDFGTDASKTAGIDDKITFGYSPMQEQYAHTPFDKVRTDFMIKALEGHLAIYLQLAQCSRDAFET